MKPLFERCMDVSVEALRLMRWNAKGGKACEYGLIYLDSVVQFQSRVLMRYTDMRDLRAKMMTLIPEMPEGGESVQLTGLDGVMVGPCGSAVLDAPWWSVPKARLGIDGELALLACHASSGILAGVYQQARLCWQLGEDGGVLLALQRASRLLGNCGERAALLVVVRFKLAIAAHLQADRQLTLAANFYRSALVMFPSEQLPLTCVIQSTYELAACGAWVDAVGVFKTLLTRLETESDFSGAMLDHKTVRYWRTRIPIHLATMMQSVGDHEAAIVALQEALDVAYEDSQQIDAEHVRLATEQLARVCDKARCWPEALHWYERLNLLCPTVRIQRRISALRQRAHQH
jgi:hypothetical protein